MVTRGEADCVLSTPGRRTVENPTQNVLGNAVVMKHMELQEVRSLSYRWQLGERALEKQSTSVSMVVSWDMEGHQNHNLMKVRVWLKLG